MRHALLIATANRGKLDEFRFLLEGIPVEILSMSDVLREPPHVVEDGQTFAENAIKKARAFASATMMLTLADDSGLEVEALNNRPGVLSARFAHERATDAENNAALLRALETLADPTELAPPIAFRARFLCALALVDPYSGEAEPRVVEGSCEGSITRSPRGSGGFGYDPLFLVGSSERTMAELTVQEKNEVSHRARACQVLRPVLEQAIAARNQFIESIAG